MDYCKTSEYENGTILYGESDPFGGPWPNRSGLRKWENSSSPLIAIRCGLGTIVASVGGEAGTYDDLCVDLVADDGRILQLSTVSCYEPGEETGLTHPKVKVFSWDGIKDDAAHVQEVTTDDTSCWF